MLKLYLGRLWRRRRQVMIMMLMLQLRHLYTWLP